MPKIDELPEDAMYLDIDGLPVVMLERGCWAYDPDPRRYNGADAFRNGRKVSREEWEKLVAEHAN